MYPILIENFVDFSKISCEIAEILVTASNHGLPRVFKFDNQKMDMFEKTMFDSV